VLTRSEADAEEIVQDSFLTLIRKARQFRPETASLRTWQPVPRDAASHLIFRTAGAQNR
jgi:hypothetical protein